MVTWKEALASTKRDPRFKTALEQAKERAKYHTVYPPSPAWFKALELTPLDDVKVVILGQDPYHQPNQANGLAFSVHKGVRVPPSLENIYKELHDDLGIPIPSHGDLTPWATQGVLLLNTTLTVEASRPASHANLGWEWFTDRVIEAVSKKDTPVVFMLWGAHARKKRSLINPKHLVLTAPHPSPLSAHRGFFGCKHFSRGNAFLSHHGMRPIDYRL